MGVDPHYIGNAAHVRLLEWRRNETAPMGALLEMVTTIWKFHELPGAGQLQMRPMGRFGNDAHGQHLEMSHMSVICPLEGNLGAE